MNSDDSKGTFPRIQDETELAIALSLCKEGKRLQLMQAVREHGNYLVISRFISATELATARACYETSLGQSIEVVLFSDSRYPVLLREIPDPPPVIFILTRRTDTALTQRSLAIVGTRSASIEVCEIARQLGQDLAQVGITVVSGLALGIDGAAHRGALCSTLECPTIAVLAHGLDRMYPPSHRGLAEQIVQSGGALVSEYPPGVEPRRHHFLARNRIIAGLVRGVIVVQAGARSGSLVTASFAADCGRDVFVFDREDVDERSAGSRGLIEQGAIPIRGVREILREYGEQEMAEGNSSAEEWRIMPLATLLEERALSQVELLQWEVQGRLTWLSATQVKVRLP
jgi:DNA processing protein